MEGPLAQIIDFTFENILQCVSTQAAPSPVITAMPNAIVNLGIFFQASTSAEGARPDNSVATWFLNPVNRPNCNQFRIVALGSNPNTWARHIVNAWRDLIEDGFRFRLYLVRPTSPAFGHQPTSPHLILVQRPINNLRSVLVSATHV